MMAADAQQVEMQQPKPAAPLPTHALQVLPAAVSPELAPLFQAREQPAQHLPAQRPLYLPLHARQFRAQQRAEPLVTPAEPLMARCVLMREAQDRVVRDQATAGRRVLPQAKAIRALQAISHPTQLAVYKAEAAAQPGPAAIVQPTLVRKPRASRATTAEAHVHPHINLVQRIQKAPQAPIVRALPLPPAAQALQPVAA